MLYELLLRKTVNQWAFNKIIIIIIIIIIIMIIIIILLLLEKVIKYGQCVC